MSRWNERNDVPRGEDYDARWAKLAAQGTAVHGEVDFIQRFQPESVLDAGCGTGRVAIELAARGVAVVGVDLDATMLATARQKAPAQRWIQADLATVKVSNEAGVQERFDVVAMPGNVMIFVAPGTEGQVVANLASHLNPTGCLIAGFQLGPKKLSLAAYDQHCAQAGLALDQRWATWDGAAYENGDYAVSVHKFSPTAVSRTAKQ